MSVYYTYYTTQPSLRTRGFIFYIENVVFVVFFLFVILKSLVLHNYAILCIYR